MKQFYRLISLIAVSLFMTKAIAQSKFVEGKDFKKLETEIPLHKQNQPEVAEYFWFGCPHCYHLHSSVKAWKKNDKPNNTNFYPVPATSGTWEFAARAMYIAEKLKLDMDKFEDSYFNEIHAKRNRGVAFKNDVLAEYLHEDFGVSRADFDKAAKSLQVKSKIKTAQNRNLLANVTSVPVFIVNGKYLVTAQMAKTESRMFEIINHLLAKETPKKVESKKQDTEKKNNSADAQSTPAEEVKKAS